MGAALAPTRFSLVRISFRDLVADGKSLVRNSVVGGGGEDLILSAGWGFPNSAQKTWAVLAHGLGQFAFPGA